jgi:CheY-like chemotaxis protein
VKIYLPRLLRVDEAVDEAESAPVDRIKRDRSILVVEDDDDVRAYTVDILRELGYRVLEAHDGPSALRLIERQDRPIDLMFTDVVMPGMSGRELADRARAVQPELKIIYTSGYTRSAIVHGGRLDAGVEVIAKPFTFQALAEKVVDVLEAGSGEFFW